MKPNTSPNKTGSSQRTSVLNTFLQILLIVVILGCGIALATHYLRTEPKAKPQKRQENRTLVEIKKIAFQDHQLTIEGMGTVLAAKTIDLTPGVGGEIVNISKNLVPGGRLEQGKTVVTIDPIDFKLDALELQNEVDIAKLELDLEMGNQRIAQKEFEILGENVSDAEKKLMLREPQLKMLQATLKNKQAKLAKSELSLSRTKVSAPFNSIVISTQANIGSRVSQSTPVAKLVGTDEFWIKLLLPVEKLKWIDIPSGDRERGSNLTVYLKDGPNSPYREGRITRLTANLEEQGKLAIVYAAIDDPLCLRAENSGKPKLLLGAFVRAEIEGVTLKNVLAIHRNHLRENNSVWIMGDQGRLNIRPVEIIARNKNQIFVRNSLQSGEKLITSLLPSPVEGTKLRLTSTDQKAKVRDNSGKAASVRQPALGEN